MLKLKE